MAYTLINHLDNYAKRLKCLNDQGGKVNITVGRNIYNDDTVYPIAFNNLPSVNIINIADTLDQDGWVTSAIKSITNLKFTYITAQNSVTGISWIAIGN